VVWFTLLRCRLVIVRFQNRGRGWQGECR
jgi:hypothetical protein